MKPAPPVMKRVCMSVERSGRFAAARVGERGMMRLTAEIFYSIIMVDPA
jgi:hypothetical protein